ncbi:MAG: ThuA domain-containing protein [Defluviitaleaceae bacterium]|nr:ThuA domain-containing protein [Defluviitaleaceae bacterium]
MTNIRTNVLIYTEDIHAHGDPSHRAAYPISLHDGIASAFPEDRYNVRAAEFGNIRESITPDTLAETDVLFWWGHDHHADVPDDISKLIITEVQKGMGFVGLHSAHLSKPLTGLLGSSGTLSWRMSDKERIWTTAPFHPISQGIPEYFDLNDEEVYAEPFDIPTPEDTVFIGWFGGGEVFRAGVTYRRGYGKVFYFQPGHESFPTFYNPTIQQILRNAADWAKPTLRRNGLHCPNVKPM